MNKIILLDIDNTLLIPQNIFIYYSKDGVEKKLTPEDYADIIVTMDDKKYYDYVEFRDNTIIRKSIETAKPLWENINIAKKYIDAGYQVGFLTARGQEPLIKDIMPKWLMEKTDRHIKINTSYTHAVNDLDKKYIGYNDSTKKLEVIKSYSKMGTFDEIIFMDDNAHTMGIINDWVKENGIKNIKTILV